MKFILSIFSLLFLSETINAQNSDFTEWYLKSKDSLDIYVKEVGTGQDTVIVLHGGFGANHLYMLDAIAGLENQFHFVLYDQRGSVFSPAPLEKLTFERNVDDLYSLITELRIQNANIVCHSMGTLVGMEFLKQHPEKVKRLTLIGALPTQSDSIASIFDERYEKQLDYLQNRLEVKKLLEPYEALNGTKSTQVGYYNYSSQLTDKEQTELWRIQFASVNIYRMQNWRHIQGGRTYYKQSASVMANTVNWNYDYRKLLNEIEKTTVIMGDHDFIDFNGEKHIRQLQDYPNVHVEVVEKAGHNIWTDNPADFRNMLHKALVK